MYRIFYGIMLFSIYCLFNSYEYGKTVDRQYSDRLGGLKRIKLSKLPTKIRKLLRFDKTIREQVLWAGIILQLNGIITFLVYLILAVMIIIFSFSIDIAAICVFIVLMIHTVIHCSIVFIAGGRYEKNMKPYRIRAKRCWKLELLKCVMVGFPSCKVKVISSYVTDRGQMLYRIKYGKYFVREFDAIAILDFKPKMDRVVMASYTMDAPYFKIYAYADRTL